MNKVLLKRVAVTGVVMFMFVTILPVAVSAVDTVAPEVKTTTTVNRETAKDRLEAAKTKLTEAKLKVCRVRERTINNIMLRQSDRGAKQLEVFSKISDRVQAFYTEKGRTVDNYDALVAAVNAAKTDAEAAVAKVKETSATFKCDGTDPKGSVAIFKETVISKNAALKTYKTAVKNLIVGVKSAQGTASSADNQTKTGDQQ